MRNEIERIVIDIVASRKALDPASVAVDATFEQLGIDSLESIEILFALEDRLNINIPDTAAKGMRTLADIVAALRLANVQPPPERV